MGIEIFLRPMVELEERWSKAYFSLCVLYQQINRGLLMKNTNMDDIMQTNTVRAVSLVLISIDIHRINPVNPKVVSNRVGVGIWFGYNKIG